MSLGVKSGGRQAGTPNKVTKDIRETLKMMLSGEIEGLPALLETLPTEKRIEYLIKLLPYILPKVDNINASYDELNWFNN